MNKLSKIIFSSLFLGTCVPHYTSIPSTPSIPSQNISSTSDSSGFVVLDTAISEAKEKSIILPQLSAPSPSELSEYLKLPGSSPCPKNMASIEGKYCIDKWEASIVDKKSGIPASPLYIADNVLAEKQYLIFNNLKVDEDKLNSHVRVIEDEFSKEWIIFSREEFRKIFDRMAEMPARGSENSLVFEPKAVCLPNVKPAAYVSREIAYRSCDNAGKRLCTADEWYHACAGPNGPKPFFNNKGGKDFPDAYPYGKNYQRGKCNIGLLKDGMWPPGLLGRKNNWQMTDPRIANLLDLDTEPMIKNTGSFSGCVSGYGVYDLVGNLHEIVADTVQRGIIRATYMGSHFARQQKESCAEITQGHWSGYTDYSIGFRCCAEIIK